MSRLDKESMHDAHSFFEELRHKSPNHPHHHMEARQSNLNKQNSSSSVTAALLSAKDTRSQILQRVKSGSKSGAKDLGLQSLSKSKKIAAEGEYDRGSDKESSASPFTVTQKGIKDLYQKHSIHTQKVLLPGTNANNTSSNNLQLPQGSKERSRTNSKPHSNKDLPRKSKFENNNANRNQMDNSRQSQRVESSKHDDSSQDILKVIKENNLNVSTPNSSAKGSSINNKYQTQQQISGFTIQEPRKTGQAKKESSSSLSNVLQSSQLQIQANTQNAQGGSNPTLTQQQTQTQLQLEELKKAQALGNLKNRMNSQQQKDGVIIHPMAIRNQKPNIQGLDNQLHLKSLRLQNMRRSSTMHNTPEYKNKLKDLAAQIDNKNDIKKSEESSEESSDSFTSSSDLTSSSHSQSNDDSNSFCTDEEEKKPKTSRGLRINTNIDEISAAKNFIIKTSSIRNPQLEESKQSSQKDRQSMHSKNRQANFATPPVLRKLNTARAPELETIEPFIADDDIPENTPDQEKEGSGEKQQQMPRLRTQQTLDPGTLHRPEIINLLGGNIGNQPTPNPNNNQEIQGGNLLDNNDQTAQQSDRNKRSGSILMDEFQSQINQAANFKRSNHIYRQQTTAQRSNKDKIEGLYDEYYAALYSKDGYSIRDIYPEAAQKLMFMPDDTFKQRWEIFISLILLFTAVMTPYRIGFVENDSTAWVIINYLVDASFLIDIILCFVSAYEDENEELVHDRWIIAKGYLKSWFFIDVVSILPLSEFFEMSDFAKLARIARLPKLYRLIRMFKLIRLLKVIKERNTISKYLNEVLKLSVALERLTFFCFMFFVLVHITACLWVILSSIEDDEDNLIAYNGFQNLDSEELYIACFYYTTVIVTTIGYGDIVVRTPIEQIFCLILLIVGVVGFSFAIGSLSSVMSSLDAKAAKLKEKLATLEDIRNEFKIPYDLYRRLRLALNYDHSKNADEQMNFLNELPQTLKVELSVVMHQELVKTVKFFRHKPPHFIAFLAPLLRPTKCEKNLYIYKEGDPIDEVYFLVSGQAGYALHEHGNAVYVIIDQGYYFGEIDFIAINDHGENDGKRKFAARTIQDCDLLVLSKQDLLLADEEFEDVINELFQNAAHRLKRTIWLKKKCMKTQIKIEKQEKRERRKRIAAGEKIDEKTDEEKEGQPGFASSASIKEGRGDFLENLQKKLKGVQSETVGGNPLADTKDIMQRIEEGELDEFMQNNQSSQSSAGESSSSNSNRSSSVHTDFSEEGDRVKKTHQHHTNHADGENQSQVKSGSKHQTARQGTMSNKGNDSQRLQPAPNQKKQLHDFLHSSNGNSHREQQQNNNNSGNSSAPFKALISGQGAHFEEDKESARFGSMKRPRPPSSESRAASVKKNNNQKQTPFSSQLGMSSGQKKGNQEDESEDVGGVSIWNQAKKNFQVRRLNTQSQFSKKAPKAVLSYNVKEDNPKNYQGSETYKSQKSGLSRLSKNPELHNPAKSSGPKLNAMSGFQLGHQKSQTSTNSAPPKQQLTQGSLQSQLTSQNRLMPEIESHLRQKVQEESLSHLYKLLSTELFKAQQPAQQQLNEHTTSTSANIQVGTPQPPIPYFTQHLNGGFDKLNSSMERFVNSIMVHSQIIERITKFEKMFEEIQTMMTEIKNTRQQQREQHNQEIIEGQEMAGQDGALPEGVMTFGARNNNAILENMVQQVANATNSNEEGIQQDEQAWKPQA